MPGLNQVTIIGRLGKDPEVKSFSNGGRICNMTVATSEAWKDKTTGERKEKTEWHNVTIQADGLIGIAEKYLSKGSEVALVGKLQTRKWQDRDGLDRYTTEIVIGQIGGQMVLIGGKGGGGSSSQQSQSNDANDDIDDDVPF